MELYTSLDAVTVSFDAVDTTDWARYWPCSELKGREFEVTFDTTGLIDLQGEGVEELDSLPWDELSALVADMVDGSLSEEHPCHYVMVGQFQG